MKIYTKKGDTGNTSLYRGGRVSKSSQRVKAYGEVDELNAQIGWLRSWTASHPDLNELLAGIQTQLFTIGSDLATSAEAVKDPTRVTRIPSGSEIVLEQAIDCMEPNLALLTNFILPGGSQAASAAHICRAVCRRAEREVVALAGVEEVNPAVLVYLNRLSDFFFVLARELNRREGIADVKWENG